ncbi:glycosyltransferase family 2 protein [Acinetobacter guerrae]|uniref:Glycosyltransferase family 2 protein n=1 Tax=Acinetobacter guerrae TaxID=1843371 RepID=A0A3A8EE39_9GAMM|nr:glycosyltransferase family 2 protein [Acinetobacter guerrae]RKG33167.1 glycosyltransferase family 2 protein [Acinetobacter guerrae]
MKENFFLTIVVAAYNVSDYIEQCIDSLKFEELKVEIIVINDFSHDITRSILNKYKNIKIINLDRNIGISQVRNMGIDIAQGQYITFIDGDDYIDSKNLENFLLYSSNEFKKNIDVFIGNYINFYEDRGEFIDNKVKYEVMGKIFKGEYIIEKFMLNSISGSVWKCIYNLDFIRRKSIKFMENVTIAEDVEWLLRTISLSDNVLFDTSKLYYIYRTRNNSVMNSGFSQRKYDDSLKVVISLITFTQSMKISKNCRKKIHIVALAVFLQALGKYKYIHNYDEIKFISKKIIINNTLYSVIILGLIYSTRMMLRLLALKYK